MNIEPDLSMYSLKAALLLVIIVYLFMFIVAIRNDFFKLRKVCNLTNKPFRLFGNLSSIVKLRYPSIVSTLKQHFRKTNM